MRTAAFIRVICDKCEAETEIELTLLARGSYDGRNVSRELHLLGWATKGDEDICEMCNEGDEDDDSTE